MNTPVYVHILESELEAIRSENRELRVMCALAHAGTAIYCDDGCLQDSTAWPFIDWAKDPVEQIQEALRRRAVDRMQREQASASVPL